jgi:hypothetical protein
MNTSIQELSLDEVQEVSGGFFFFDFSASFSLGFSCEPKHSCEPKPSCQPKPSCEPKPPCGGAVTPPPVDAGPILS